MSIEPARKLCLLLSVLMLGSPTAQAVQTIVNGPAGSDEFGQQVVVLPNGNIIVTDPSWDDTANNRTDAGAVYLYSASGTLISTLKGGASNDRIGSAIGGHAIVVLPNGNYVIRSSYWTGGAVGQPKGAVTFGSATAGVSGTVSNGNSLVGQNAGDSLGSGGVFVLPTGNYLVASPFVNGQAGAVTFGSGRFGVAGFPTSSNSLVGSAGNQSVGGDVTVLSNGNYIVMTSSWMGTSVQKGAITLGNGTTGTLGAVNASNSWHGRFDGDLANAAVKALSGGRFAVQLPYLDSATGADVGAVLFGNGSTPGTGPITEANAVLGASAGDNVGIVTELTDGDCVISSPGWRDGSKDNVGAVTFVPGCQFDGTIQAAASLIGSTAGDMVGGEVAGSVVRAFVYPLSDGDFAVASPRFSRNGIAQVGAVTVVSGATGMVGVVGTNNSVVGSTQNDGTALSVTPLTNGNLVAVWPFFDGMAEDVGAATFVPGTAGVAMTVSLTNSVMGDQAFDRVGDEGVAALTNGNYVVMSGYWHANRAAHTFGNGQTGVSGVVSASNSFVGAESFNRVGSMSVLALPNGNYVMANESYGGPESFLVPSNGWVAFANGATGKSGVLASGPNVIIGGPAHSLGSFIVPLANGNFVIPWMGYDGIAAFAGALLYGNQSTGFTTSPNVSNSLLGAQTNDAMGFAYPMANGNYVVEAPGYDNFASVVDAGLITIGRGLGGTVGVPNSNNAVIGNVAGGGGSQTFDYDNRRNQLVVGQRMANRIVLFRPGEASTTTIQSVDPSPAYLGSGTTVSVLVQANSEPVDGRVTVRAVTGETCQSETPQTWTSDTARFTCSMTFASTGTKVLTADYSNSFRTAYSESSSVNLNVQSVQLFSNGFE